MLKPYRFLTIFHFEKVPKILPKKRTWSRFCTQNFVCKTSLKSINAFGRYCGHTPTLYTHPQTKTVFVITKKEDIGRFARSSKYEFTKSLIKCKVVRLIRKCRPCLGTREQHPTHCTVHTVRRGCWSVFNGVSLNKTAGARSRKVKLR